MSASFEKASETTRYGSAACTVISGETTTNSKNYTCGVYMWYWDGVGVWSINVSANDLGNKTYIYNSSTRFSYGQLQAIKIQPPSIAWTSVVPGSTNELPNSATTINNTGNYDVPTGSVQINGTNLLSGANVLAVKNITAGIDSGAGACSDSNLSNGIFIPMTNSIITAGNLSEGGGVGQEVIYYCLTTVPSNLPSGTYDTSTSGAWTIKIV